MTPRGFGSILLYGSLLACDHASAREASRERAPFEVHDTTQNAFSLPMPGLSARERTRFFVGNSFFNQNWVSAPSSVHSRDGLGPLFNARSCSACHFKDGRGAAPERDEPTRVMLLRVSAPGGRPGSAPRPDPRYGDQLQIEAIPGARKEAEVRVSYHELPGTYPDGEPYSLRRPVIQVTQLGNGALADDLLISARVPPALVGLGLLEAVPERDVLMRVDADDRDGDGISGRANMVPSASSTHRARLGRFGWKAEQATLLDQTAAAFVGDMGITSRLFENENHAGLQTEGLDLPSGGSPEIDDDLLASVVSYTRTLAVPARRDLERTDVRRGEQLFARAGCGGCHVDTHSTSSSAESSELAARTIHPYTDLLLHDMGEGLADGRPSFAADGAEWRTPPLWGLGLVKRVNGHSTLLHDGRARGVSEAILWHGGEASSSRATFLALARADRLALVAFVESL
jgi:CxxC motif-containing protein (DUF1111 family)